MHLINVHECGSAVVSRIVKEIGRVGALAPLGTVNKLRPRQR
jgi:hypothetical protein